MNATGDTIKPIVPRFFVQEEGSYKVFIYLSIPELKVKRSFLNFLKFIPSNGYVKVLDFQNQSFIFTINVQTKLYSISIARLLGKIQPERCSIKYQHGGCWITLIKLDPMPWMNRVCDDLSPGLDIQEDDNQSPPTSAPPEEALLKDTDIPLPFNLVPLASYSSSQSTTKKRPAPPPPFNIISIASSASSQQKTKKGPAPLPPVNLVPLALSPSSQPKTKKRPAPLPPTN
ncbi:unnamed protein product [Rotaria sordida]|uniref:Uncharacterized protein n=1 Tax=Rotaria sordida TaxID=392033 RepID=A0A819FKY7_9BILA|nr:unnamed protein product [Rotaria sordida]CAF3869218.1 unnamed protein product [Rotaria sordida]